MIMNMPRRPEIATRLETARSATDGERHEFLQFSVSYEGGSMRSASPHVSWLLVALVAMLTFFVMGKRTAQAEHVEFLFSFGSFGTGNGEFDRALKVAIGGTGNV